MRTYLIAFTAFAALTMGMIGWQYVNNQPMTESANNLQFLGQLINEQQIALGKSLYGKNCAACHGEELEGQPDWQTRLDNGRLPAPPHDESGHTWHHSDQALFDITKYGISAMVRNYESDMPGFADGLTDEEIIAILAFIKSTWPERQRDYQQEITIRAQAES